MANQDVKKYENFRQNMLDDINTTFQKRIDEELKELSKDKSLPQDVKKDVSTKFKQTFSNYLATAFDIVIGNERTSNLSTNEKETENGSSNYLNDQHNLSVTDEHIQEMDDSIVKVASRRKQYPKKCTQLLDKTLEYQAKAAVKIKVSVNSVQTLKEPEPIKETPTDGNDQQQKLNDLQSSVRKQIQKSVRLESALKILGETQSYEKKSQD